MTKDLKVHTDFEDINALAAGFVDRIERDTLILYGADRHEPGDTIEFNILLVDGVTALEGSGEVRASVDGGDERPPELRYDVIIEKLNFEGRYSAIFERMLLNKSDSSVPPDAAEKEREATQPRAVINAEQAEEAESSEAPQQSERPSRAPGGKKAKGNRKSSPPPDQSGNSKPVLNGGRTRKHTDRPSEVVVAPPDAAQPPSNLDEPAPFVLTKSNTGLSRPRYPRLERAMDSLIPKPETPGSNAFHYAEGLPVAERPPMPGLEKRPNSGSSAEAQPSDDQFDDLNSNRR